NQNQKQDTGYETGLVPLLTPPAHSPPPPPSTSSLPSSHPIPSHLIPSPSPKYLSIYLTIVNITSEWSTSPKFTAKQPLRSPCSSVSTLSSSMMTPRRTISAPRSTARGSRSRNCPKTKCPIEKCHAMWLTA